MTFSLSIQAETFEAFRAHLNAIAAHYNATTTTPYTAVPVVDDPVMPEVKTATRSRKAAEPQPEPAPEVEETQPEPEAEQPAPAPGAKANDPAAETGIVIPDKETDKPGFDAFVTEHIIPRVTKVVAKHGKPHMEAILKRFDVAKATLVPADKLPLLLKQMDEALEA